VQIGKVCLVCNHQSGMAVLKFILDKQNDAVAEEEVKAWRTLDFPNVYIAKYNDTPAIIMPVAFIMGKDGFTSIIRNGRYLPLDTIHFE